MRVRRQKYFSTAIIVAAPVIVKSEEWVVATPTPPPATHQEEGYGRERKKKAYCTTQRNGANMRSQIDPEGDKTVISHTERDRSECGGEREEKEVDP